MTEFQSRDLPAFRAWAAGFRPPADTRAFLITHIGVTTAFLFSDLLVPNLLLVRGCVILSERYDPVNFESWWESQEGNTVSIERVLNHLHLWDILEPSGTIEEQAVEVLAARIARIWALHGECLFPDRRFITEVTDEYGPTIVMSSELRLGE